MWLPAERLSVSRADRRQLTRIARDPRTPPRVAARVLIVLGASDGTSNSQLAQDLSISRPTVIHWRRRFEEAGVAGLLREPLRETLRDPGAGGLPQAGSSCGELGLSAGSRTGRRPAGPRTGRQAPGKLLDIAGIYVHPPDRAVAFSVEEKDPAMAEPLPTDGKTTDGKTRDEKTRDEKTRDGKTTDGKTRDGKTKDYIRHGTTTLFAALGILAEKAAGAAGRQPRTPAHARSYAGPLLEFLETLDRNTPPELQVHLIVDHRGTHEDARLKAWFAMHARFHVHCTPAGGSWINLTKRWWFAEMRREQMRHRALGRVAELVGAVDGHIAGMDQPVPGNGVPENRVPGNQEDSRAFVWTAESRGVRP